MARGLRSSMIDVVDNNQGPWEKRGDNELFESTHESNQPHRLSLGDPIYIYIHTFIIRASVPRNTTTVSIYYIFHVRIALFLFGAHDGFNVLYTAYVYISIPVDFVSSLGSMNFFFFFIFFSLFHSPQYVYQSI